MRGGVTELLPHPMMLNAETMPYGFGLDRLGEIWKVGVCDSLVVPCWFPIDSRRLCPDSFLPFNKPKV